MAEHNELGKRGEDIAVEYLKKHGYSILARNWHSFWRRTMREIDIIAKKGDTIVFVEVKTRSSDLYARPEEAVDSDKQQRLLVAANYYIKSKRISLRPRMDIIAIVLNDNQCEIKHMEDAFYPTALPTKQRKKSIKQVGQIRV